MYSSTSLSGPASHGCWKQVDYALNHTPSLHQLYYQTDLGVAAHAVMQYAVDRQVESESDIFATGEGVARSLIANGRAYRGHQLPPLPADEVYRGVEIATDYLMAHPVPRRDDYEELSVEQEYTHPELPYSALLDLYSVGQEGDDDYTIRCVEITDYKTAWPAGESELTTLQRQGHAMLGWRLAPPDTDCVRVRVVNLRTWKEFSREWYLNDEADVAELRRYEKRIAHLCNTASQWPQGERPTAPGVGCIGCPWGHLCPDVLPMSIDKKIDASNAILLSHELAKTEARRDLLVRTLKRLLGDQRETIIGGYVGYKPVYSRTPKPGAESEMLVDWLTATATEVPDDVMPVLESLLVSLKLGKGNLAAFSKSLFPERKKGIRELRDDYVQKITTETHTSRFGVWED